MNFISILTIFRWLNAIGIGGLVSDMQYWLSFISRILANNEYILYRFDKSTKSSTFLKIIQ